MRTCFCGLLVASGLLLCTGCVFYPYSRTISSRPPIHDIALKFLNVGSTSIEDVLFELGEPEEHYEGPTVFLYRWVRVTGFVFFGVGPAPGAAGGVTAEDTFQYTLHIAFDESNKVVRYKVSKVPLAGSGGRL